MERCGLWYKEINIRKEKRTGRIKYSQYFRREFKIPKNQTRDTT